MGSFIITVICIKNVATSGGHGFTAFAHPTLTFLNAGWAKYRVPTRCGDRSLEFRRSHFMFLIKIIYDSFL